MKHLLLMYRRIEQEIIETSRKRAGTNRRDIDSEVFAEEKHYVPIMDHNIPSLDTARNDNEAFMQWFTK